MCYSAAMSSDVWRCDEHGSKSARQYAAQPARRRRRRRRDRRRCSAPEARSRRPAHKPRRLAGRQSRDLTVSPSTTRSSDARAARRRPKAARDIVETNFGALALHAVFVRDACAYTPGRQSCGPTHGLGHLLAMSGDIKSRRYCVSAAVCHFTPVGDVFDEVRKSRVSRRRLCDIPPDPVSSSPWGVMPA